MPLLRITVGCLLLTVSAVVAHADARDLVKKDGAWFKTDDARKRLQNILTYQDDNGCWPKNMDTTKQPYRGKRSELSGTFDNRATTSELRLLARAYTATARPEYKQAFDRGLACILDTQYKNGGWPQNPKASGYHQHITFNDGAMVRLMTFLREVTANHDGVYDFTKQADRDRAAEAFDRGVQCILKCQIKVDGKLTAWCAQHDEKTLEPRGARSYEHPSLSGGESAEIACLLMSLPQPSEQIKASIRSAIDWFNKSAITGFRFDKLAGDKVLIDDSKSILWARFYEIKTNRPIFSGRDGVIKYDVMEIEPERRNGYSWYVNSGKKAIACWNKWSWK